LIDVVFDRENHDPIAATMIGRMQKSFDIRIDIQIRIGDVGRILIVKKKPHTLNKENMV
jgi:hypothetical protein